MSKDPDWLYDRAEMDHRRLSPMDIRRHRAQVLTAEIMRMISPMICEHEERHLHREAHKRLFEFFWTSGHDFITDMDRANAGLPQRGVLGWTEAELRVMENQRLMALVTPLPPIIIKKPDSST